MKIVIAIEAVVVVALLIIATLLCVNLATTAPQSATLENQEQAQVQQAGPGDAQSTDKGQSAGSEETPEGTIPTEMESTQSGTVETEPTWLHHEPGREILAEQYFVYDVENSSFVTISGNLDERIYPASVTKLFTCYVALQYLEPEEVITVGDELDFVVYGSSVADLREGDKLTVSQLVEAMLLPSGNDAAYVLAVNAGRRICGDSSAGMYWAVEVFMNEMNKQVKEVGMTGTHFANPDGIHSDSHYTTFGDLAVLAAMSIKDDTIMKNAVIAEDTVTFIERGAYRGSGDEENTGDTVKWKNTNELINPASEYYCPYATGLKTGQTPYAGSCLLSSFEYEGKSYIIGVFKCPEKEDRFDDTLQLFNETIAY